MDLPISLILILSIIILYIFFIEIFTMLFRISGLTKEKSKFQVISMFTNSGFTTNESEMVVNSKIRRKIAVACMITGTIFNVIIVSLIINLLFNIKPEEARESYFYIILVFSVFVLLLIIIEVPFVKRIIEKIIKVIAEKFINSNKVENIITVLDMYGKNAIVEVRLNFLPEFLSEKSLIECNFKANYGLNVLLIKRKERVIDVTKDTIIQVNDNVVIFGELQNIKDLFGTKTPKVVEIVELKENIISIIDNFEKEAMVEILINFVPSFMQNKSIIETRIREQYGINILIIKRDNQRVPITKDTIILKNDEIIVLGPYTNIKKVFLYNEC